MICTAIALVPTFGLCRSVAWGGIGPLLTKPVAAKNEPQRCAAKNRAMRGGGTESEARDWSEYASEGGDPVDSNLAQAAAQARSAQFFEALRVLRVSWIIPILAFLTLAVPPQVRDLYRTLAESKNWPQIAVTALLLLLAAYLTYRVGRHRALVHAHAAGREGGVLAACLRWGPALCGGLVLVAAAFGIYVTTLELPAAIGIDDEIDGTLVRMGAAQHGLRLAAAALALVALLFPLFPLVERWRRPSPDPEPSVFAFAWAWRAACYAAAIAMMGMAFYAPASVPASQWLGSLAIFLLFLCVLLVVLSVLQSWSDRLGVPLILVLLLWMLALAVFDRGATHQARLIDTPNKGHGLIQVQYALLEWYRERKDKDAYRNEPYPVYLIAAEGGGLYAARFAADVLARLQDLCPNFAQHVFAISSVSGGSLGASVFSSLAKKYAPNGPWQPCRLGSHDFEQKVHKILDQDFLAPIVSRAFFADFLQLFFPHPFVVSQFSRGRALEEAVEYAWAQVEKEGANPFAGAFLSHWSLDGAGPALMLNTTSVTDGRQVVIAPFGTDTNMGFAAGNLHLLPEFPTDKDLTLGAAVGLSSRFPWILPAATVGDKRLAALVDGAYFEGSGVEALSSVKAALRPYEVKPNGASEFPYIAVHVIVIGSVQPPVDVLESLDEVTPPLRTMLRARERRGYIAYNSMRDLNWMIDCPPVRPETTLAAAIAKESELRCASMPPLAVRLNYDYFKLPLGWQLSSGMQSIIDRHSQGRCFERKAADSPQSAADENLERAREYLTQNYLVSVEVAAHLSAGKSGIDVGIKSCE